MTLRMRTRVVAAAAAAVALAACAPDGQDAQGTGSSGATPSPRPSAPLPYVAQRHQLESGLLGLQHVDGALWATQPRGAVRIDPASGTTTAMPDFGQLAEAYDFLVAAGHLWVPDFERSSLTRIRLEDLRIDRIPVLHNSEGIAYGFGSVWVSNHRSSSVQRLDPVSGRVVATVTVGSGRAVRGGPSSAVVAFGHVWVAVPFLRGVVAIDPSTNRVVKTALVDDGGCSICGDLGVTGEHTPAPDDDGIWAVGDTALHRIDPRRAAPVATVPLELPDNSGSEAELATTPESVFVSASRGRLLLVDQTTAAVQEELVLHPEARNVDLELAYGGGRLWAYERFTGRLSGIDPALVRDSAE